jgi:hypothetical protein
MINLEILKSINFRNFNLQQLWSLNPDVYFEIEYDALNPSENLTIGDCFECYHLSKGTENLYFSFIVYRADDPNDEKRERIICHTKDSHDAVKEVMIEIIRQA